MGSGLLRARNETIAFLPRAGWQVQHSARLAGRFDMAIANLEKIASRNAFVPLMSGALSPQRPDPPYRRRHLHGISPADA